MIWLIAGGAVLIGIFVIIRLAKSSGRKGAEIDAYEEVHGDVTDVKRERDRLDADELDRLRGRYTR